MPETLVDVLGSGDPSAPGLIVGSGGRTYTRGEIHQLAIQFAETLRGSGISAGDVVTIADPNTIEFVVAFLGATYARAVAAPLNQNYTTAEFGFYMDDSQSKILVTGAGGNPAAEAAADLADANIPVLSVRISATDAAAPSIEVRHHTGDFDLRVTAPQAPLSEKPQPGDVALFLHTSGTTSRPKGVPLTHANLVASIENIAATYEFSRADVSLLVMPLFHVHGLMAGLLAPLNAGASVVLPAAGRFSAGTFWEDAVAHRVTYYTAVPTMHQILVSRAATDFPKDNPPSLRVIRSCSSSLAPATLAQLEAAFGAPVLEAYAMTEASHQMTSNPLPKLGPHKPGTVGKPQGSVKVTILGSAPDFPELGPGEVGEICIRGPNVTAGYVNNPTANADSFVREWFRTGDQGKIDEDGYLTLTGRIKELINRGGEKISPIEVDGTLLSHPDVADAVSFAAPDPKYGEVVAAAVVLTPEGKERSLSGTDMVASIKEHCAARLAAFKVPSQIFIADELPKTATGKVQRRLMVEAFITPADKKSDEVSSVPDSTPSPAMSEQELPMDGFFLTARTLAHLGIRFMFGVVGIPVTQLASAAQACGIRFIGCRNEQAAGYAAAAVGFLTGVPGVLLTVSGPGVVHGLAGLSNAQTNCWPMLMISGSCETAEVGKGSFQELDQMAAVQQYVKHAAKPASACDIPQAIADSLAASVSGRPGASFVDLPSDILMHPSSLTAAACKDLIGSLQPIAWSAPDSRVSSEEIQRVADLLRGAKRPLFVIGKGAAYARSESQLLKLVDASRIPFLATAMGRGVVPDDHACCANAARSLALAQADVAVVFGARLNWQLHFGEPPKWSTGVKFVLVDPEPSARDASLAFATLRGDAGAVAVQLLDKLGDAVNCDEWRSALADKAAAAASKMSARLAKTAYPLDYSTAFRVIRDALNAQKIPPVVVSEGANTMDQARVLLSPVTQPRCRLDAGTWGTMGVGPGYALAAAVSMPKRSVIAVEGDSAFGFSAMEVETACRYRLPIVFIIMNNGGIYGGDRRAEGLRTMANQGLVAAGHREDPAPTSFVPGARYDLLATAFGGSAYSARNAAELEAVLKEALEARRPAVINVQIDPMAGVESGNVHAFNAPKGK